MSNGTLYDDIIKRAPVQAQERIRMYAESVDEAETPESLRELYGVQDIKELIQHLVEYESGTCYDAADKLIADYKLFWQVLGNVYGDEENAIDTIRSKQ